ncbi:MAG: hypothetical protein KJ626_11245 [Verrucomicrobia bacterium]|nr:hypothetical protein [Verrucomicrobiota bacterium]
MAIEKAYQGFIFAYELTANHLSLKLLRLIRLGRIDLSKVAFMRSASAKEAITARFSLFARRWPSGQTGLAPAYLIETQNGKQVVVRLKPGFHYRVRSVIGRHLEEQRAARDRLPIAEFGKTRTVIPKKKPGNLLLDKTDT